MSKNEFYEVYGMDKFVPVELISICDTSCHIQINTPSGTRDLVVDKVYSFPKTPKVVVPQFVADWIEKAREEHLALSQALDHYSLGGEIEKWLQYASNQELFARAWLDGYEVEQEKLYTVEILGASLFKATSDNHVRFEMVDKHHVTSASSPYTYIKKLTEKEIKSADERLWLFAKEVG